MKGFICLVAIILCILFIALPAFAVNGQANDNSSLMRYLTWEDLGTLSGATAAVLLIVQFLKAPMDKIWKIPTRYIVYIISLLILFLVEIISKIPLTMDRIFLTLLNAIVVTMTAMGAYEITFRKTEDL